MPWPQTEAERWSILRALVQQPHDFPAFRASFFSGALSDWMRCGEPEPDDGAVRHDIRRAAAWWEAQGWPHTIPGSSCG